MPWKNLLLWMLVGAVVLPSLGGALSAFAQPLPPPPPPVGPPPPPPGPPPPTDPGALSRLNNSLQSAPKCWSFWGGVNVGECLGYFLAWISYIMLSVVGTVLSVAGLVFNITLGVTIDNINYTAEKVPAIALGWQFSRDIVNIFFIFILLFIAIATILGIESYSARRLLVMLIIMALLVNFSFLIAQTIIFVSNALTKELYEAIHVPPSQFLPKAVSASNILSLKFKKDISGAITNGFAPQNLLIKAPFNKIPGTTDLSLYIGIIEIAVIAIILILFASLLLFVASFFFVARLVTLWFLLIFAPFGFVFLILPQTQGYAKQWWKKLWEQAIFAPVFMFVLAIAIFTTQRGFADFLSQAATTGVLEFVFLLGLQGIIVGMLFGGTLLVSKQMGIYGAGGAMKIAEDYGKAFRGYAAGGLKNFRNRAVGTLAAPIADKISGSAFAQRPYAGALARLGAKPFEAAKRLQQRTNDERENKYKAMSSKALASTYRSTANPLERKALLMIAAENRKMKDFRSEEMETAMEQNKGNSKALRGIYAVRPDLVAKDQRFATASAAVKLQAVKDEVSRLSEVDIRDNLDKAALNDSFFQQAIISSSGERETAAMLNKFGDDAKDAIEKGKNLTMGPTVSFTRVFDELYNSNKSLLRGLYRNPALSNQFKDLRDKIDNEVRVNRVDGVGTTPGKFKDYKEYEGKLRL